MNDDAVVRLLEAAEQLFESTAAENVGAMILGIALYPSDGGDAATLYRSIRKVLALPPSTRLYLCHDYLPEGRSEYRWETTVAEQNAANVHIHAGVTKAEFVALRKAREAGQVVRSRDVATAIGIVLSLKLLLLLLPLFAQNT